MDTLTRPFADALAATPVVLAQGRNIEAKVYAKRYPACDYARHLPIVTKGPPWAIGTTFFTVEALGEAKFISGAGKDMRFNNALLETGSSDFALIGAGWEAEWQRRPEESFTILEGRLDQGWSKVWPS